MTLKTPLKLSSIPTLDTLLRTFPGVNTFLFDMDGTLFDTEKYHAHALIQIGIKYQINPPYPPQMVHDLMIGKADHLVFELIRSWDNFPKEWVLADFLNEKNNLLLDAFAKEKNTNYFSHSMNSLLQEIKNKQYFVGLVTSSEKVVTKALLKHTGLEGFFNLELTRDDCPQHKPDPWPYKKAMEMAHSDIHETLIFEDSVVGLTAATSSGAHVVKVIWYTHHA